jgi:hypothetical protein
MYIVVSHWEVIPGHEEAAGKARTAMRAVMSAQPGVEFMNGFTSDDGKLVAVHAYKDEAAYKQITGDPNGAFAKAAEENQLEQHMRWLGSQRGTAID